MPLGTLVARRAHHAVVLGMVQPGGAAPLLGLADLGERRLGTVSGTLASAVGMTWHNAALRARLVSVSQREDVLAELARPADSAAPRRFDAAFLPLALFDGWMRAHPDSPLVAAAERRPIGINLGFVTLDSAVAVRDATDRVIVSARADGSLARWATDEGVSWAAGTVHNPPTHPAMTSVDTDAPTIPLTPPSAAAPASALRRYADLPGPRRLPLLGNLLQIDAPRLHLQLEQWCHEFGPYFRLKLGPREVLVVGDHAVVAAMLRDRPDGFGRTPRLLEIWLEMGLPVGLFGANGDTWRAQRRMVMAGFDPAHVKRYFPAMVQVAQRLRRRWQKAARQGTAIDLQADLMRYTVDTIAGLAFGAEVDTLASEHNVIQQHLDKLFPALFKRILAPLPTWRLWRTPADRQLERSITEVKAAVAGFIAQARSRMQAQPGLREQPDNLLEAMIAAADQPDSRIDDAQVAGNVLTMLLAGEDTTANTIAWMVHLLWRHPAALARATDEVRRVCGGALCAPTGAPTLAQLHQLDFVEACAFETMRLKPVAPQLPLQALRDTVLGDVQVPAGMVVIGMLRRDSISEQHVLRASAFEPERWLVDDSPGSPDSPTGASQKANSARRISMPFGAGPRICPGRYLALLEIKLAMATLLSHFDIADVRTPDGREAQERLSFTMTPVGLRLHLRPRGRA